MCTTRNYFTHKYKYISYAVFKVIRVLFEGLGATMLSTALAHRVSTWTRKILRELCASKSCNQYGDARFRIRPKIAVVNSNQLGLDICD